jgi:serine phosphatase RsbU (regulator of sigma subunit)
VCPPLGVGPNSYHADIIAISPGDRLVMVTDGYLERDAGRVDILHILETGRAQHPRQVVQELARNVLAVTGGRLRDDATVLCVDFYGADGHRDSVGGASPDRLSPSR